MVTRICHCIGGTLAFHLELASPRENNLEHVAREIVCFSVEEKENGLLFFLKCTARITDDFHLRWHLPVHKFALFFSDLRILYD